MKDVMKGQS